MRLSVVVPMYNEEKFIHSLLTSLLHALECLEGDFEIIVVDDGSMDKSIEQVESLKSPNLKLHPLSKNIGKGGAVREGIGLARGSWILIQDADLEYDPRDIESMLIATEDIGNKNVAVYGSRILGAKTHLSGLRKALKIWPGQGIPQRFFNFVLSLFHLILTRIWITDLLTGYKLYPSSLFDGWTTVTSGFETDHEITMKIHRSGLRILEVPVHYRPRSKEMGKKIRNVDAFFALATIWRFRK